jgi:hypothetical protein
MMKVEERILNAEVPELPRYSALLVRYSKFAGPSAFPRFRGGDIIRCLRETRDYPLKTSNVPLPIGRSLAVERELTDRAEMIQKRILQLRDSL